MSYDTLASSSVVAQTTKSLENNGIEVIFLESGAEALEMIKNLIPDGATVMNGSSRTLEQIGFVDLLKEGGHSWNNLHDNILAETDLEKQMALRRQSVLSDYYLGSVHALTENGELIIASNTSSQLPHVAYTSPNLILVVSTKKIVPNLDEAMNRLEKYVMPLEDENMLEKYNIHTQLSTILIVKKESQMMGRKFRVILVNEDLGF